MTLENRNAARLQFGKHAEKYRKSRTHSDAATLAHIVELIGPSGSEVALDVGCGGGHMAAAIAKDVRELVAVDVTPEMLVQTGKLAEERSLRNLSFCTADARNLPFQSGAFDVVSCRIVLHHVRETAAAVAEMGRVLKTDGKLIIQDILGLDGLQARRYMDEIEVLRDPSHVHDYGKTEWRTFLAKAGLQLLHSELIPGVYMLDDWTTRSGTSPDRVEKIKNMLDNMPDQVAKYLRATPSGGDWVIQMRYILMLATKK